MPGFRFVALVALSLLFTGALAQSFSGTYRGDDDQGGQTTLTLQQEGRQVTGTLVVNATPFQLEGVVQDQAVIGTVTGAGVWFEAEIEAGELYLSLIGSNASGAPDYANATMLVFTSQQAGAPSPAVGMGQSPSQGVLPTPRGTEGGLDDGSPSARAWSSRLAGKKATRIDSYSSGGTGGYSDRTDVHLCPNGEFLMSGRSSVSVDVGGAYGYSGDRSQGNGRWRIISQGQLVGIELSYANGAIEQHRLDYQDDKTYVDGERWLITQSEVCGTGY